MTKPTTASIRKRHEWAINSGVLARDLPTHRNLGILLDRLKVAEQTIQDLKQQLTNRKDISPILGANVMKRYLTMATSDKIIAVSESEDWRSIMLTTPWDEYVWQFADNKTQAIAQHCSKHDEWSADVDAEKPTKQTY